eukprot:scaffold3450_cov323-Prasinococcus_capsulatus_cf.AAC.8
MRRRGAHATVGGQCSAPRPSILLRRSGSGQRPGVQVAGRRGLGRRVAGADASGADAGAGAAAGACSLRSSGGPARRRMSAGAAPLARIRRSRPAAGHSTCTCARGMCVHIYVREAPVTAASRRSDRSDGGCGACDSARTARRQRPASSRDPPLLLPGRLLLPMRCGICNKWRAEELQGLVVEVATQPAGRRISCTCVSHIRPSGERDMAGA